MTASLITSRILFWGGILSITLMVIGIVGFAAHGGLTELGANWTAPGADSPAVFSSVGQIARGLRRLPAEPLAIVALGIALLLMTPFLGVLAAFVAFMVRGDRRYVLISAILLTELLVSLIFATGGD